MFNLVMIGADDIEAAKRFYDATLGALGVPPAEINLQGRAVYAHGGSRFLIALPLNGAPATGANGGTLGFAAASPEQVDAWHAAGLAHGGTAIEDPPGVRHIVDGREVYLAYLRDPWGNKISSSYRIK